MEDITKEKSGFMSNCDICGRKTLIIQKSFPKSGKNKGWTMIKHRCTLHGVREMKTKPSIRDDTQ